MAHRRTSHGFTLIELLIVVAIISILAAIAVPNFLEAQTRAKRSRGEQDLAVIAAGLRSYYADFQQYPPHHPEVLRYLRHLAADPAATVATVTTPADSGLTWNSKDPAPAAEDGSTTGTARRRREGPVRPADSRAYCWPGSVSSYYAPPMVVIEYPALAATATDLLAITTPVAYLTRELPLDPFALRRTPPMYFNYSAIGGRGAVVATIGPTQDLRYLDFNPAHPPLQTYDPTNGTISPGLLVRRAGE